MFYVFTTLLLAILGAVFAYYKWKFQYWKKRGLPFLEPSIPFGNLQNPLSSNVSPWAAMKEYYQIMKRRGHKHAGFYMFTEPGYFLIDLDYVKNILTADFSHFQSRGFMYDEEGDPLSANVVMLHGEKWKNLRVKLTPTFTSGKMKMMFNILLEYGKILKTALDERVANGEIVNIKELLYSFTSDTIMTCAFGLDSNNIRDGKSLEKQLLKLNYRSRFDHLIFLLKQTFPKITKMLKYPQLPKEVTDFVMDFAKKTVEYREKNGISRDDYLQMLINLKNRKFDDEIKERHDGKGLTMEEVAAQCLVFFQAGFETAALVVSFAMIELCLNPEIQEKLRGEIETVLRRHNGEITYQSLTDMKYMDQVINESMRKYPTAVTLTRQCTKDYKVPGTDVVIEKGIKCYIPFLGMLHDEEYFPEPELFDPERFNEENKNSRHKFAYLPFGAGPRFCLGDRFGLMQSKMGLTILLKNYKFTLDPKTKIPMTLQLMRSPAVEGGVWLQGKRV